MIRTQNLAAGTAAMLARSAENLNLGGDLRSVADGGPSEHAVAADVNAGAYTRGGVGEKRPKLNAAVGSAAIERKPVIRNPQIIARESRDEGAALGAKGEKGFQPSESREQRQGKSR